VSTTLSCDNRQHTEAAGAQRWAHTHSAAALNTAVQRRPDLSTQSESSVVSSRQLNSLSTLTISTSSWRPRLCRRPIHAQWCNVPMIRRVAQSDPSVADPWCGRGELYLSRRFGTNERETCVILTSLRDITSHPKRNLLINEDCSSSCRVARQIESFIYNQLLETSDNRMLDVSGG
jgi:hypothetical protein